VKDHGIYPRPGFDLENPCDGPGIFGVRAQAVHRFGWKSDQTSFAKYLSRALNHFTA
jgi:hypothetical protein